MKNKNLMLFLAALLLATTTSSLAASGSEYYHMNCNGNHDNDNGNKVTCSFVSDSAEQWHWTTLKVRDENGGEFQCGTGSGDKEQNGRWIMTSASSNQLIFTCVVP